MTQATPYRTLVAILALLFPFNFIPSAMASVGSIDKSESQLRVVYRGQHLPDRFGDDPQIAIYDGQGTWTAGKEGFKHFLVAHNIGYQMVSSQQIKDGALDDYEALFMPGGESWQYLSELGTDGGRVIRDFVGAGGSYMGICAGAFYATSRREGGVATGPYGIGLLEGTAYDGTALHTPPFIDGVLRFDLAELPLLAGLSPNYHWLLLGGPSFRYSEGEAKKKQIQVLARFQDIGEPAMILLQYGKGRVFLSAPHIEVEPGGADDSDAVGLDAQQSGWPVLERVTRYELYRN